MESGIFAGADLTAILSAFGMATIWSALNTFRVRREQREQHLPLTPWDGVVLDTLTGGATGGAACVVVPHWWPPSGDLWGLVLLSFGGAIIGPPLFDWVRRNGLKVSLSWAGSGAGRLSEAIKQREGGNDGSKNDGNNP